MTSAPVSPSGVNVTTTTLPGAMATYATEQTGELHTVNVIQGAGNSEEQ
jgi:hypothetical protein